MKTIFPKKKGYGRILGLFWLIFLTVPSVFGQIGQRLPEGQSTPGFLTENDRRFGSGRYYDLYVFEGGAGQTAIISMSSWQIDSRLLLYEYGQNRPFAINDDREGFLGKDAEISSVLPKKKLYLVAATSSDPGETGSYTIRLELEDAPGPIIWESQQIDDDSLASTRGNSNGIAEAGEIIGISVILKNTGIGTAKNVKGSLSTKDKSVNIIDGEVSYGSILPRKTNTNSFPTFLDLGELIANLDQTFMFEIEDDATPHKVAFMLKVTADNGGPWEIEITVPIGDTSDIRIESSEVTKMISEVAFGKNSTYFILNAQYLTLTGVPLGGEVHYGDCTITLDLPAEQGFVFPLETPAAEAFKAGANAVTEVALSLGTGAKKQTISTASKAISSIGLISSITDFISKFLDLWDSKVVIEFRRDIRFTGLPNIEIPHLVLLTERLPEIKISVVQEYTLGESLNREEVEWSDWVDLDNISRAAPAAPTLELKNYPPMQSIPPEIQQYLILRFSELGTAREWRVPDESTISQNYPNPFNPETWIPYQLAKSADVTLTIYNIKGKLVRRLALGYQPAGIYQSRNRAAYWDGKNELGEGVASGVYFYTIKAGDFTATRKMLIRK